MSPATIITLSVIGVVVLWAIFSYNSLVTLKNRMKNAWSQIDVQLKRRHDLIPNIVETVKGYAKHESGTLEAVMRARSAAVSAGASGNVGEAIQAENMLTQSLSKLLAVVEAYPDLKANQNFLALQEELTSTENKIGFSRQHYNDEVMTYNTKLEVFPSNILGNMFGFKPGEFFQIENAAERVAPKVQF